MESEYSNALGIIAWQQILQPKSGNKLHFGFHVSQQNMIQMHNLAAINFVLMNLNI